MIGEQYLRAASGNLQRAAQALHDSYRDRQAEVENLKRDQSRVDSDIRGEIFRQQRAQNTLTVNTRRLISGLEQRIRNLERDTQNIKGRVDRAKALVEQNEYEMREAADDTPEKFTNIDHAHDEITSGKRSMRQAEEAIQAARQEIETAQRDHDRQQQEIQNKIDELNTQLGVEQSNKQHQIQDTAQNLADFNRKASELQQMAQQIEQTIRQPSLR